MKKQLIMVIVSLLSVAAFADWEPGDPYKMHFPQLPDPDGWDVMATAPKVLADDWLCTETGPVGAVHLWGSWRHDDIGKITKIHLSIHDNIPAAGPDDYSRPGKLLWERDFGQDLFVYRDYGTGQQGWYNPNLTQPYFENDHLQFNQINITNIQDPFWQERDQIYWLDVYVEVDGTIEETFWGWKSSLEQYMDDAVWADVPEPGAAPEWKPLYYPNGLSMDLAFVIVPEPVTLMLLGVGAVMALRRR